MTDLRQAAQQALKALEWSWGGEPLGTMELDAITALRTALEQPEQGPVAWAVQGCSKMWRDEFAWLDAKAEAERIGGTCVAYALYTTPQPRLWVGLTEGERNDLEDYCQMNIGKVAFDAIEAKLKERNT
jgi:hypothetical protein